jgi:LysR family transcriptional activator of mexEF-oprN operon
MTTAHDNYGRDLDLNLLRVFAVIAEEGSVTRAAARLYVTQPAISASLRRLTEFVGGELFTRQGRGVVLTNRGVELLAASREHLRPLIAAATAAPVFDPRGSTATVRVGLSDPMQALILPEVLKRLRVEAPKVQIVVVPVQFRTVEEQLLSNKIDLAVTVADELPRSILRKSLRLQTPTSAQFVCLFDPRFSKLPKKLTERDYFAREHVVVSYAGDARGIVEDAMGRTRNVRVSLPAFSHVADVVDGSPLLATLPTLLARHILETRPHLDTRALPFSFKPGSFDLLWSRVTDDDAAARFIRGVVADVAIALEASLADA